MAVEYTIPYTGSELEEKLVLVDTNKENVDTLTTKVDKNTTDISTLDSKVTQNETDIASLNDNLANLSDVASTGSYNDLSDIPSTMEKVIGLVKNQELTLARGGIYLVISTHNSTWNGNGMWIFYGVGRYCAIKDATDITWNVTQNADDSSIISFSCSYSPFVVVYDLLA